MNDKQYKDLLAEMPTPCARCNEICDLNEMWHTDHVNPYTASQVVCDTCHDAEGR